MKKLVMGFVAFGAAVLFAAPGGKGEAVAEGYPDWQGIAPKNYILGREITPSDLRHKATIVIEIEPCENLFDLILKAGQIAAINPLAYLGDSENWETRTLPRHTVVLVSVRGGGKNAAEAIKEGMKVPLEKDGKPRELDEGTARRLYNMRGLGVSFYSEATFTGAPDTTGKRPYVYVLGPTGTEPLFQGKLDDAAYGGVSKAVNKAKSQLPKCWVPFYGSIPEPQHFTLLGKTLEKGKNAKMCPLAPVSKALLKEIASKDAETATEAQILYDAIEQTRSDLLLRIRLEYGACPHRAIYDVQQLTKYWPGEKKRIDAIVAKLKANPEASKLAMIYCKVQAWSDPEFTCKNAGEAKKIVAELNKMKKDIEKMKESTTIVVQNGALLLDSRLDELISVIPTKLPEK